MGVAIPGGLSFLLHGDWRAPVPALTDFPPDERPPVVIPFVSYHIMIAIGFALIGLSALGVFYWYRGTLIAQRWLLWLFLPAALLPYIGNQAGWVAAEVGRQPYIVWGELRTADALSPAVSGGQVLGSIMMFGFIYTLLFALYLYIMNDKIQKGPEPLSEHEATSGSFLEVASSYADHGGPSMTAAREKNVAPDEKEQDHV